MEGKGGIRREKNPRDGRGVLIKLTDFGKEKRAFAKAVVLRFNNVVKANIGEEQLNNFFEVTSVIRTLINENAFFETKNV